MIHEFHAAIFDLDGVIVDTAKYHYLAWKRLAQSLGFDFSESQNERLKGVSRARSLEILLEIGGIQANAAQQEEMAAQKNAWYVEYIQLLKHDEILPGVLDYLRQVRARGIRTAIGSASKNTLMILEKLDIVPLFDAVIDGNLVTHAKPDPEVFQRAAEALQVPARECIVFEDATAGIQAALSAGMGAVGIGNPGALQQADVVVSGLWQLALL
jgi:beta-phosphoglucomutase